MTGDILDKVLCNFMGSTGTGGSKRESIFRNAGINFTHLSHEHEDQYLFEQFHSVQSTCMKDDLEDHIH